MASGWSGIILGSLALAGLSLVVMRGSIGYDPYSWLIWGREMAHLDLDTRTGATSVKPLPMVFGTIFAFTGSKEPALWLFIARAGAIFMFGATFRLAWRVRGPVAGIVAVAGLAVSDQLLGYLFMRGMAEPMAAAFTVAAVDAFLLRRQRWAVGCLVTAAYLRAEAWPILLIYLVWLAWPHGWVRRGTAVVVGIFVPVSWFLFDVFGAHQFFRSAQAASAQSAGGPLTKRYPGLATFTETWHLASGPVVVLFVVGLAVTAVVWWRSGHPIRPLDLSPAVTVYVVALAWLIIDAVLAQGGFATGAERYLLPAEALACVAVGWLVCDAIDLLRQHLAAVVPVVAGLAALVVFGAVMSPWLHRGEQQFHLGVQLGRSYDDLAHRLPHAIKAAGGRKQVIACGQITTQRFQVPLVAWQLHVHIALVTIVPQSTGVDFQQSGGPRITAALAPHYRRVASFGRSGPDPGSWVVYSTCPR